MMNREKWLNGCDKLMACSFYALIFFLPISTALVESFSSLALVAFFIKRGIIFSQERKKISGSFIAMPKAWVQTFLLAYKPRDNFLNKPLAIFVLINFLSILMSQYPGLGLKGFFFKLLQAVYIYFTFIECIETKRQIRLFLGIYFVSATLIVASGIIQYYTGKDFFYGHTLFEGRIVSAFRSPNDLGAYLVMIVPLLLTLLIKRYLFPSKEHETKHLDPIFEFTNRLSFKFFTFMSLLVFAACLGLTLSRAAWIGFVGALFFLVLRRPKLAIVTAGIISIFFFVFSPRMLKERKVSLLDIETYQTGNGRLGFWKEAVNIITDYPALGVGLNAYSQIGRIYKISWGGYPHNCYLQMAAEIGVGGALVFIITMIIFFRESLRNLRLMQDQFLKALLIGLLAGFAGYLILGFFDTTFYSVMLGNLLWLIMGFIVAVQNSADQLGQRSLRCLKT